MNDDLEKQLRRVFIEVVLVSFFGGVIISFWTRILFGGGCI